MQKLIKEIENIPKETKELIDKRLGEFSSFADKGNEEWFSELCFCILTANSRAKTAIAIQKELGYLGFSKMEREKLVETIKRNKHRFHNNKAKYISLAREHLKIKDKVKSMNENEAREWLVENIKGLGYKESSHFLRNVGYVNLAILDRHIINLMKENGIINDDKLTRKNYLIIEQKFKEIAEKVGMNCAKLDLSMWYLKTGEVLK
jgi:N-glycosylase/DNA lyase